MTRGRAVVIDKETRILRHALYQILQYGIPQMSNRADRRHFEKLIEDALNGEGKSDAAA